MALLLWLYVSGFAITVLLLCKRDFPFIVGVLLQEDIPDDLPEWALPLVILIVVFFGWPFILHNLKR